MRKKFLFQAIAVVMVMTFVTTAVSAQGVLGGLFKNVEADPNKAYMLTETEGPYLIFVTSFSGPTARQEAHSLVLEFRKSFKWYAYVYEKKISLHDVRDFKPLHGSYMSRPKYLNNPGSRTEFAVVIGNFPSMEDKQFTKTLDDVRKSRPSSLKDTPKGTTYSCAFGLLNPMVSPEHHKGVVDDLIKSINEKRPYTLLRNPRRYTVQVATFEGHSVMKPEDVRAIEQGKKSFSNQGMSDLERGEQSAVKLCQALRAQNIEAYEFHDRHGSIVTVGSFDFYTQQMPDGRMNVNPLVQQVIQRFQAEAHGNNEYKPKVYAGIICDPQPKVIEVPRASQARR
jgi:hypothetical protein